MGLIKKIELENGIVLNYHRISSVNKITNECNVLQVLSYISKEHRSREKQENNHNVFMENVSIPVPYDDNMTITDAYNVLKTKPMFQDSTDDMEA